MASTTPLLRLILFCAPISLFLAGCAEQAPPEEAKPTPSWEWEPEDPELVLGKTVYSKTCYLCHNEGEESAPRIGSQDDWAERIARGEADMIKNAIKGFFGDEGHMPPRGDNDSLTDEEVSAAVRFMVAAPKR